MSVIRNVEAEAARFIQDFSKHFPKAAFDDVAATIIGQKTNSLIKTTISYARKANKVAVTVFQGDIASTIIYLDQSKVDLIYSLKRISHLSAKEIATYYFVYCLKVGAVGYACDFLKKWTIPSIWKATRAASEPDSPFDDITLLNVIKALGGVILPKIIPCDELTQKKQSAKRLKMQENDFILIDFDKNNQVTESTETIDFQKIQTPIEEPEEDWYIVEEDPFFRK